MFHALHRPSYNCGKLALTSLTNDDLASDPGSPANKPNARKNLIREHLLDKAAQLFVQRGYANTRIQDIAEEMGLSRSSLYHYFQSKDEVLLALTEEIAAKSVARLEALKANKNLTPSARLHNMITGNVFNKLEGGIRFRMLDRIEAELPDDIQAAYSRARRRVLDLTVEIIKTGIEAGEFRRVDAKIAAFSILGMTNWTAWWYSPGGDHSPQEIADAMASLVIGGLQEKPGHNAPANLGDVLSRIKADVEVAQLLHKNGDAEASRPPKASAKPAVAKRRSAARPKAK